MMWWLDLSLTVALAASVRSPPNPLISKIRQLIPMTLSFRICLSPLICRATLSNGDNARNHHANDAAFIKRAAHLAELSAGLTSPHPNFGCVIATSSGKVAGEGYLYAQGTKPAEVLAVEAAGEFCRGSTAYLNMETGDCHGDHTAVSALVQAGIERVVVGIRHPLQHLKGSAIRELRSQGVEVNVLGEDFDSKVLEDARKSCHKHSPSQVKRVPESCLSVSWVSSKSLKLQVGPDMLVSGFLQPIPDLLPVIPSEDATVEIDPSVNPFEPSIIFFYKTWDLYGSFSNFSPHPIRMPYGGENDGYMTWSSVEHYYQANKFVGVENPMAHDCVEKIRTTRSPEEAALIGRTTQRQKPELG